VPSVDLTSASKLITVVISESAELCMQIDRNVNVIGHRDDIFDVFTFSLKLKLKSKTFR